MQPFASLAADRQAVIAEAATRDLADPNAVHEIVETGRGLYGLVLDPEDSSALSEIGEGEVLFDVGLDTFVRGRDIEEAFREKPDEWSYVWLAKSLYGEQEELAMKFSDLMDRSASFLWHGAEEGRALLFQESAIGTEVLGKIGQAGLELTQHIADDFPEGSPVYRIDDYGDYVAEADWNAVWEKHSPWFEEVWMLIDNGDYTQDDVAKMPLGYALQEFNHNEDLVFENAFFTEWEGEEPVHAMTRKIDPNISVFVMGEEEGLRVSGGWLDLPASKESIERFMRDVVGIDALDAYGFPCREQRVVEASGIGQSPNWLGSLGFDAGQLTAMGVDKLNTLACCWDESMHEATDKVQKLAADNIARFLDANGLEGLLTFEEAANLLKQAGCVALESPESARLDNETISEIEEDLIEGGYPITTSGQELDREGMER